MTVNELIAEKILPATETLIKKVEELEQKQKKLEREIKYYWRMMNLLLFLQVAIIFYKEFFKPFIYWLYQLF